MRSEKRIALATLVVAIPVMSGPACAAEFASTYTRHDFQTCAKRRSPEPGIIDVRACSGHGGTPVVWTGEPDSSSVAFGKGEGEPIPGLDTFYEPRGTVEWRGPSSGGSVRPVAAILRYDTGPAIGRLSSSRLVVYRLAPGGRSCVMGVVRGSTQDANAAARALIDRNAAGFVCGKNEAIVGS